MAVLHKKEEKIQAVLGRLSKKYTHEQFVEMFIKLYSKDWGKIKSAYIKQSQDKEPGTVINMPKPDLYLKQILESYLKQNNVPEVKEEVVLEAITETAKEKKAKVSAEKINLREEENTPKLIKVKAPTKKNKVTEEETATATAVKKPKTIAKKKVIVAEDETTVAKKATAPKK